MSTGVLDPGTMILIDPDKDPLYKTTDTPGDAAHIVKVPEHLKDITTPQAYVLEARIEGKEVQALCGYTWVPQKDPKALPVCSRCLEIYQTPGDDDPEWVDRMSGLPDA